MKFVKLITFAICYQLLSFGIYADDSDIHLSVGQSVDKKVNDKISVILVSNPEIADYKVISNNQFIIYAKQPGYTNVSVFGENKVKLYDKQIYVSNNMTDVELVIKKIFPESDVVIISVDENVVLTGLASSLQEKESIYELVGELLGKERIEKDNEFESNSVLSDSQIKVDDALSLDYMTRFRYKGVVNQIKFTKVKQVNVRLMIAEVSNTLLNELGVTYGTDIANPGTFINKLKDFSSSSIFTAIKAHSNRGKGQVLAEPNLSVLSGESASFLVGGELPIITTSDGGANVEYRQYGVGLNITAKVMSEERIILSVIPEVSTLDTTYTSGVFSIPSLRVRRAHTTYELSDGESFILGGLISKHEREQLTKIPFLGDIPVLGSLFTSVTDDNESMELVIVAQVNLVDKQDIDIDKLRPQFETNGILERLLGIENTNIDELDNIGFIQ